MDYEDCCSSTSSSSSSNSSPPPPPQQQQQQPTPSPKRKAGRKKFRETRHPVYRGVRERGKGGKWVCEVREPNKKSRIWLGTYPTPEMAARAHDVAAIALRGEAALLNFPDSARALPRAASSRPSDIRRAAAEAAGTPQPEAREPAPAATPGEVFVDEEAMLDMPGLLRDMAEGMMVTPPGIQSTGFDWEGMEEEPDIEMTLWSP